MSAQKYASKVNNLPVDVLIIGAGPSGASCAYWLARAGYQVVVVEKKRFPREKTCGDGLTPRSVRQLEDMGLSSQLSSFHRFNGLRTIAHGKSLELPWPYHEDFPSYGYVIARSHLDELVAKNAQAAGAVVLQGHEAISPIFSDNKLQGATIRSDEGLQDITARLTVVAEGANSRFGRLIGISRNKNFPHGIAIRGYFNSAQDKEPWVESHLDLRDKDGNSLPGYGWLFPLGDGRVNVGVGILSTSSRWKDLNTSHLMQAFLSQIPSFWQISPDSSCGAAKGGHLPMGLSVGPRVGENFVVIGDAAGTTNPFNGEGIAYAYETGRLSAFYLSKTLATNKNYALYEYEQALQNYYGLYYSMARTFVKAIGNPKVMSGLTKLAINNRYIMNQVVNVMANLLRPQSISSSEITYSLAANAFLLKSKIFKEFN